MNIIHKALICEKKVINYFASDKIQKINLLC